MIRSVRACRHRSESSFASSTSRISWKCHRSHDCNTSLHRTARRNHLGRGVVACAEAYRCYASPVPGHHGALLLAFRLITGLSPLGFFVSYGGYMWFVVLAWVAAALVRAIRGLP